MIVDALARQASDEMRWGAWSPPRSATVPLPMLHVAVTCAPRRVQGPRCADEIAAGLMQPEQPDAEPSRDRSRTLRDPPEACVWHVVQLPPLGTAG